MSLYCFHFAGGNEFSYNKIINGFNRSHTLALERDFSLLLIDKIICNSIGMIVNSLMTKVGRDDPFYIYGHSMGALLAYLVCQKLQEENLPMPQKLIVSGKKSPSIPKEKKISHLPDEEFWNEVVELGGTPDEIQNYPELIEYYLPILRHDFRLVENYQYEMKPKLNIPIDVFYGSEEAVEKEMLGWQDETTEKTTITQLPGNHFFIFDHIEYFRNYFDNLIHQK